MSFEIPKISKNKRARASPDVKGMNLLVQECLVTIWKSCDLKVGCTQRARKEQHTNCLHFEHCDDSILQPVFGCGDIGDSNARNRCLQMFNYVLKQAGIRSSVVMPRPSGPTRGKRSVPVKDEADDVKMEIDDNNSDADKDDKSAVGKEIEADDKEISLKEVADVQGSKLDDSLTGFDDGF